MEGNSSSKLEGHILQWGAHLRRSVGCLLCSPQTLILPWQSMRKDTAARSASNFKINMFNQTADDTHQVRGDSNKIHGESRFRSSSKSETGARGTACNSTRRDVKILLSGLISQFHPLGSRNLVLPQTNKI